MTYQDQWKDGKPVGRGYRACEERYALVRKFVAPLGAGFTVLDVGAAEGYFAIRLVEDFNAKVTAVEPRTTPEQVHHPAVRWVHRPFDVTLGKHDVVLALSLLHHVPTWRGMLFSLIDSFNQLLIVETPHPKEQLRAAPARHELALIDQAIRAAGGVRIGDAPGVWDKDLSRGLYAFTKTI